MAVMERYQENQKQFKKHMWIGFLLLALALLNNVYSMYSDFENWRRV